MRKVCYEDGSPLPVGRQLCGLANTQDILAVLILRLARSASSMFDDLLEEHFGPTSVIIRAPFDQYLSIAKSMSGQLASALHATAADNVKDLVDLCPPIEPYQVTKSRILCFTLTGRAVII